MDPVAAGIAALVAAGVTVVPPDGWGATVDYSRMARRPIARDGQRFVHWVGTSTTEAAAAGHPDAEAAALRSAERYHVHTKGWAGLAYDVGFGNSGLVYLIRGDAQSAATSGDVDMDGIPNNVESDALLFIVGAGQLASPAALRSARIFLTGHGTGPVIPHRGARGTSTSCPGEQLAEFARTYQPLVEGPPVTRLAGTDRYDTAAMLARTRFGDRQWDSAVLVRDGTPDTQTVAQLDAPILLVTDVLPDATAAALRRHRPKQLIVVGGEAAIPAAVEQAARHAAR